MFISEKCDWTPYGTNLELDKKVKSVYLDDRVEAVKSGYGLDVLINDKSEDIRAAVAQHGYGLDILINDESDDVRLAVAQQGYGLDKLANDKYWLIREEVAKQGYGLDKLVNDTSWTVRVAVVKHGYGLNKLINDNDIDVRKAVVNQNYGLDKLIDDEDCSVNEEVECFLKVNSYKSITDWIKRNPDRLAGTLTFNPNDIIKEFVYKVDDSSILKVESSYSSIDEFFDDASNESYESNESLIIITVDTKIPLIKLEKTIQDGKPAYKFIVDTKNDDGLILDIVNSKEKCNQLLTSTISVLKEYPQYSKYADNLENCI